MNSQKKPSVSPPKMADIAKRAGVSRMAVSAVLMGTGGGRIRVSTETAERIRQIAQEINYRPNPTAQQLARKRSGVVAIVAKDWKNYLTQSSLAWLHEAAEEHGFRIMTARGGNDMSAIDPVIRDLQAGWIDGLVYFAYQNEAQWAELKAALGEYSSAVVVAVGDLRIPGVVSVISDIAEGARASFLHLVERGYRRPVFITEEADTRFTQTRMQMYCSVAREQGIRFDENSVIVEGLDWLIGNPRFYPKFDGLLRKVRDEYQADAVICDSDFTAAALIRSCYRQKVSVPDELAILGWGNLQFANATTPSITTVSYNLSQLLSVVLVKLQQRLNHGNDEADPDPDQWVEYVPPALIIRETT